MVGLREPPSARVHLSRAARGAGQPPCVRACAACGCACACYHFTLGFIDEVCRSVMDVERVTAMAVSAVEMRDMYASRTTGTLE